MTGLKGVVWKMNRMKAFVKTGPGADDLAIEQAAVPEPGDRELLIRIKAVGVGIHDSYFLPQTIRYPYVLGIEAAGIVEETGSRVTGFRPGDRVAFVSSMHEKGGTWAEFAVVSADSLILPIPDGMSFEQAAAVPVAGNTALKALSALDLKQGDSLFIAGASGAIGTLAIQLATGKGCTVAGSASKPNHPYMKSLGADRTVDYRDPDWKRQILDWKPGGVDAAMAVQPGTSEDALAVVRDGGRLVTVSGDRAEPERGIRFLQIPHKTDVRRELNTMINQIADGKIHVEIEQVYPFSEGLQALRKTQTRHARGKLVLTLD